MTSALGTWQLCSWSALWAYQFEPDEQAVATFLYQAASLDFPDFDEAGEAAGSLLTIHADGRFTVRGKGSPPVVTYGSDGTQVAGVAEFEGVLHDDGNRSFLLRRELPVWATPRDPVARTRLRWDDNDTKVCDSITLLDGQLVRMICVVTDECYGDRIVLVYRHGSPGE